MEMLVASLQPGAARQGARALDYIAELKYDRPVTIFDDQLIDERRNVTYAQEREHSLLRQFKYIQWTFLYDALDFS